MYNIRIETDRLSLRVPVIEDAVEVNSAMNEVWHDLQMWMSWAYDGENTLEATCNYFAMAPQLIKDGGLPLLAFCRDSGKFVVATGLTNRDGIPITGYWVAKDFLGKGYATEATNAVLRYAFGALGLQLVGTEHYGGNEKSRRIIERLGFTHIKTTSKTKARCLDGTLLDEYFYEMRDPSVLPDLKVKW